MIIKMNAKNAVRLLLATVGITVFFNGAVLCFVSNMNTGLVLTVLLGLALVLYGVFFEKIQKATRKGFPRVLKMLVAAAICFEVCLVGYVAYVGERDTVTYDEDAVIVLGAGLRGERITVPLKLRLDKTLEYHGKNPDALIIVSGGQGQGEATAEAYAMKKYLVQKGVPEHLVIEEDKATSTSENFKFSKKILQNVLDKSPEDIKIAFVTNNFHVFRSSHLAKMSGFDNVTYIHTPIQWYNYIPFYLRETLAIFKMWILKY